MDTTSSRYDTLITNDVQGADRAPTPPDAPAMTIAATFADGERARDAVHQLHNEGFHDSWIGRTRSDDGVDYRAAETTAGETRVESDNWFMRFFGEGEESLHDALVRRGVSEADAHAVGELPAHSAILTVDGSNHPELAVQIIAQNAGRLITRGFGAGGYRAANAPRAGAADADRVAGGVSEAPAARTTSLYDEGLIDETAARERSRSSTPAMPDAQLPDATAYDDYGRFRGGAPVDESTRLQLREERLRIDKSRIARGEATIETDVVTEAHDLDIPLIREELFIERRPAREADATGAAAIGSNEIVRIPLTEEQLTITKVPVVTEEIVVGKRAVETVEHISETTRKEELRTNDGDDPISSAGAFDLRK